MGMYPIPNEAYFSDVVDTRQMSLSPPLHDLKAVFALDRGLLHLARNHPKGRPLCPKEDITHEGATYKGVTDMECFEKVK